MIMYIENYKKSQIKSYWNRGVEQDHRLQDQKITVLIFIQKNQHYFCLIVKNSQKIYKA